MPKQISDATLVVNNEVVGYDPNSLSYTEGDGEKKIRPMSSGGKVEQVFSNDQESEFSDVSFSLPAIIDNIKLVRGWLKNGNTNTVQLMAADGSKRLNRTFTQAVIVNKPKVELGADTSIELEWMSNAAI